VHRLNEIFIIKFISALLQISCHSFYYPLEGCKKQEIWRVY
jgi:hypothetical protein